jgi:hypothetical protein
MRPALKCPVKNKRRVLVACFEPFDHVWSPWFDTTRGLFLRTTSYRKRIGSRLPPPVFGRKRSIQPHPGHSQDALFGTSGPVL